MRRMRERRKAAGLRPVVTWVARGSRLRAPPLELRVLQARSLALHVLVARKIERDPQLLETGHRSLVRWRERGNTTPFLDVLTPRERRRLYDAFRVAGQ
jgi:hypothetical protein